MSVIRITSTGIGTCIQRLTPLRVLLHVYQSRVQDSYESLTTNNQPDRFLGLQLDVEGALTARKSMPTAPAPGSVTTTQANRGHQTVPGSTMAG